MQATLFSSLFPFFVVFLGSNETFDVSIEILDTSFLQNKIAKANISRWPMVCRTGCEEIPRLTLFPFDNLIKQITGQNGRFRYWLTNARPHIRGLSDQHKSTGSLPPYKLAMTKQRDQISSISWATDKTPATIIVARTRVDYKRCRVVVNDF